jgi:hypothetical protein
VEWLCLAHMNRKNRALLILPLLVLTACAPVPSAIIQQPIQERQKSRTSLVPLSDIELAAIGAIAPKGRVQDRDYNDLPVVTTLIAHGQEALPYLISKLNDETIIEAHVMDYWHEVRVGDVALIILSDFFTDSNQNTTIPAVGWDEFLERGTNSGLTAAQVLRNYISKHGRKKIKARWQETWREYRDRVFWDENERCFKVRR